MRRLYNLQNDFYKKKFKNIYRLLFTADLDRISDHSTWHLKNPDIVEKDRPLWIIVESKILNKRIWITKDFGALEVTTAQLDLDINSRAYHNSYRRKKLNNQKEMAEYLKELLKPCLEINEKEQSYNNDSIESEDEEIEI